MRGGFFEADCLEINAVGVLRSPLALLLQVVYCVVTESTVRLKTVRKERFLYTF